jgi:hypothetical protein
MKQDILQQRKEFALMCEKNIFVPKAQSSLCVPGISGVGIMVVGNHILANPSMYYPNCHHINHNMEMLRNKKKEHTIVLLKLLCRLVNLRNH